MIKKILQKFKNLRKKKNYSLDYYYSFYFNSFVFITYIPIFYLIYNYNLNRIEDKEK